MSAMIEAIKGATDIALYVVNAPRFLRTKRGFQGQLYCALQKALEERDLLQGERILEMEYQKSVRHGLAQRPDIILHVPAEESGGRVDEGNFAVWARQGHHRSTKTLF